MIAAIYAHKSTGAVWRQRRPEAVMAMADDRAVAAKGVNAMTNARKLTGEWVALMTFAPDDMFYETGGIYDHEPRCSYTKGGRPLETAEHVAECPRCGHRFAATEDGTAESHRDLHFDGDEDIPSICAQRPS
jgi:hypothetical protein